MSGLPTTHAPMDSMLYFPGIGPADSTSTEKYRSGFIWLLLDGQALACLCSAASEREISPIFYQDRRLHSTEMLRVQMHRMKCVCHHGPRRSRVVCSRGHSRVP